LIDIDLIDLIRYGSIAVASIAIGIARSLLSLLRHPITTIIQDLTHC